MGNSDYEIYLNGERVQPPTGHILILDSDEERTQVFLGRKIPQEIPGGRIYYKRHPIKLNPGDKLMLQHNGYLRKVFVEHHGIAVDPIETLLCSSLS